jgi:NAD(P)-dependent dehydrogenase (short-subunit alcohol dehydrogenase family)
MVKKVLIFGGSGALAEKLIADFLILNYEVSIVTRIQNKTSESKGKLSRFFVDQNYLEFNPELFYDIVIFTQCLFDPCELVGIDEERIVLEFDVGLVQPILLTKRFLQLSHTGTRQDICFIGSTSAYSGFKKTSIYCAVKHGLLGFVRAMNDEYNDSDKRFWLFSMGSMNTFMGRKVLGQDASTFLDPADVSQRIVSSLTSHSNMFEPEVLIKRRNVRFT